MSYTTTVERSIPHKVLNETTGELETKHFTENKVKKKSIRGGFMFTYPLYDKALLSIVKSSKDLEIVVYIRETFTYARIENVLSKKDIAEAVGVSERTVSIVIQRMVDSQLLKRVARGVYRLNPFMYIPYNADGVLLQSEWNTYE